MGVNDDILAAVEIILDRRPGGLAEGTVDQVLANTAIVRVNGTGKGQSCRILRGAQIQAGDTCILVRTRKAGWVVIGGFNPRGG